MEDGPGRQAQRVIPPEITDPLLHAWRKAILVGLAEHPARPGRKQSKICNLLERLLDREADVLRLADDLTTKPNATYARPNSDENLRHLRSQTSATAWARIRVSAARRP